MKKQILHKIKTLAQYKCNKCGFLFRTPLDKVVHDGVVSRHHKTCPRCRAIDIDKINI